jgi:Zn-dependent peptidase ImmA (M78 family)
MGYRSAATVSHFETGLRKVSVADLQKLSTILSIPLESLIQAQNETSPVDMQQFMLRANIVRPTARRAVAEFLAFAQNQARDPVALPSGISNLRPGRAATKILRRTACQDPPVSPRLVAQKLDVPVFEWDFPNDISGIFVTNDNGICIGLNRDHPPVRQTFTIAHELGHLVYHRTSPLLVDFAHAEISASGDEEASQKETQANQFAADLLMPKAWVERDYNDPDDLALLARQYGVSEQAFWYRLVTLKLVSS